MPLVEKSLLFSVNVLKQLHSLKIMQPLKLARYGEDPIKELY